MMINKMSHNLGNRPSGMCSRRRHKSAGASDQSNQSIRCPHEETLHPWLSKMRPVKVLSDRNLRLVHLPDSTFSDVATQILTPLTFLL